jgi:hypothetical protein
MSLFDSLAGLLGGFGVGKAVDKAVPNTEADARKAEAESKIGTDQPISDAEARTLAGVRSGADYVNDAARGLGGFLGGLGGGAAGTAAGGPVGALPGQMAGKAAGRAAGGALVNAFPGAVDALGGVIDDQRAPLQVPAIEPPRPGEAGYVFPKQPPNMAPPDVTAPYDPKAAARAKVDTVAPGDEAKYNVPP